MLPLMLLGEAARHQFHGGVVADARPDASPFASFSEEYSKIHDALFKICPLGLKPAYRGSFSGVARRFVAPQASGG
ncbi:MAG: hypothetical protein AAGA70_17360 [Pseudomonadota bacterium]